MPDQPLFRKTTRGPTVTVEMDLPACRAALEKHAGFVIEERHESGVLYKVASFHVGPRVELHQMTMPEIPNNCWKPEDRTDDFVRSAMLTVREVHALTSAILRAVDGPPITVGPGPPDLAMGTPVDRGPMPGDYTYKSLIVGERTGPWSELKGLARAAQRPPVPVVKLEGPDDG